MKALKSFNTSFSTSTLFTHFPDTKRAISKVAVRRSYLNCCFQKIRKIHREVPELDFFFNLAQACSFVKKEAPELTFFCEFWQIFKNNVFTEYH